jgi:hypothetical protein
MKTVNVIKFSKLYEILCRAPFRFIFIHFFDIIFVLYEKFNPQLKILKRKNLTYFFEMYVFNFPFTQFMPALDLTPPSYFFHIKSCFWEFVN